MFQKRGIPVVDADVIAREVVLPGRPALRAIVDVFGEAALLVDGTLDRKTVGDIVFSDEAKRRQLNNIVHPAIRKEMLQQRDAYVEAGHQYVVMDIPLLFESKLTDYVDKIIVVTVDEGVQIARIVARDDLSKDAARQRIASQIPVSEKVKNADAVIDNNGSIEQSAAQLEELIDKGF